MTQISLTSLILLATREEMHRVWGRFDHERPGITANQWLIVVGVIACLLLTTLIYRVASRRSSRTFSSDSPAKLFRELCAAHGLNLYSRRLLKRLAQARGLTSPALLFVEPQHFDTHNFPAELKSSATELRQLRERLFG
ncbi:MAG: hypothetical protein L0228_08915 [Planctomycetes bacterium]|nr:hypothetical protein [Planctomycetota bacterium]